MATSLETRTGTGTSGVAIADLTNDALIIRLHFTINHLSRWLTPIHDPTRMMRTVRRGEPTVKELLLRLRDEELRVFPRLHAIAVQTQPDLDKLPAPGRTEEQERHDRDVKPLEVMAEFRRLRQSTASLLRSLPDTAWARTGTSRLEHDWSIRALAEHLARHDYLVLSEMEQALDRNGAREGVNTAARAPLAELLKLVPTSTRR